MTNNIPSRFKDDPIKVVLNCKMKRKMQFNDPIKVVFRGMKHP